MININKEKLNSIIKEEIERYKSNRNSLINEMNEELDIDVLPGYDDLKKLSMGITEKKKEKKEVEFCEPGNPYFDKRGRFTNPKKAPGSMSSGYWDQDKGRPGGCRRGKMARKASNKTTQITRHPCGRKNKDGGKARYRCYDGKKLWENDGAGSIIIKEEDLKYMILDALEQILKRIQSPVNEQTSSIVNDQSGVKKFCNKNGYQSYDQFLRAVNQLKQSFDGELGIKEK
jgi:hypothetical protein